MQGTELRAGLYDLQSSIRYILAAANNTEDTTMYWFSYRTFVPLFARKQQVHCYDLINKRQSTYR